ncbi:enterobactin transporter EntS [Streptosporangium saharense]|uniref:enterobactin transporter EntS n=1 Tax=Streptosporangium saharense TaxID=1706840 RepID=UPI003690E053
MRIALDFSPLRRSRSFRLVFTARLTSLFGIGLLMVAVPVQVYGLTRSTVHLAAVATTAGVFVFAGTLAGGLLADRHDRRSVILTARSAAGIGFLLLAGNALLPEPMLWPIYALAAWDGLATGISASTLTALVPKLVEREDLPATGALLSLTADLSSMLSPALGGVLIAMWGVASNYVAAALATAFTVLGISRLPHFPASPSGRESPGRAMAAGLAFVLRHRTVRSVLIAGLGTMLLSGPVVLLPALVATRLGGGETTLGLLYSAPAVGAVLGSLTSGWIGQIRHTGLGLLAAMLVMGLAILGTGLSAVPVAAFLALTGYGLGRVLTDILRFTLLQRHTPDEVRGRVSSLWQAQIVAAASVGSMVAGLLADAYGPATALVAYGTGAAVVVIALAVLLTPLRAPDSDNTPDRESSNAPASDSGSASDPGRDVDSRSGSQPNRVPNGAPVSDSGSASNPDRQPVSASDSAPVPVLEPNRAPVSALASDREPINVPGDAPAFGSAPDPVTAPDIDPDTPPIRSTPAG